MKLLIRNNEGAPSENGNILKTDRERGNTRNLKEGGPKRGTCTSVLYIVSLVTTGESTTFILALKARFSAPVVGNRPYVSEGESVGLTGGKKHKKK